MEPTRAEIADDVENLTSLLRACGDAYWTDLRKALQEKDIRVESALLIDKWPDEDSDFFVVVNHDGTAYEAEYVDALGSSMTKEGQLRRWTEIVPHSSEWHLYSERINYARDLLAAGSI